jgi:hypothetical protein
LTLASRKEEKGAGSASVGGDASEVVWKVSSILVLRRKKKVQVVRVSAGSVGGDICVVV